MPNLIHKLPGSIANWLRTRFGKHLSRFAGVALVSLITTQVVLSIAYLAIGTGGTATFLGWLAGAAVSYILSRRAWNRRGRPHLLKETLPFWIISGVTAVVLTTTGHFASVFAKAHHLSTIRATLVVSGAVLLANFVTFALRFLIFHYVLFADRNVSEGDSPGPAEEALSPIAASVANSDDPRDKPSRQ